MKLIPLRHVIYTAAVLYVVLSGGRLLLSGFDAVQHTLVSYMQDAEIDRQEVALAAEARRQTPAWHPVGLVAPHGDKFFWADEAAAPAGGTEAPGN